MNSQHFVCGEGLLRPNQGTTEALKEVHAASNVIQLRSFMGSHMPT